MNGEVRLMNEEDENASGDFHYVKCMDPVGPTWSGQGYACFCLLGSMGPVGPTWSGQG